VNARTKLIGTFGGLALVGVAGALATRSVGQRVRRSSEPAIDDELAAPTDVTHHDLATHDGGSLHVVEAPGGERPVVLLHGVTLQWWVWSAVIRLLRGRHRVLAWDMRGHGRSRAGSDGVTLEAAATDLVTALEQLDVRDAIVVGHSMGGMVLGRFSVQHRDVLAERVAGRVFLATSAASLSIKGFSGGLVALAGLLASTSRAGLRNPRVLYPWKDTDLSLALLRPVFGRRVTARMAEDVRQMLSEVPAGTLAEAGASIAGHDVTGELGEVDGPTLVVVGEHDRLTPPSHAKALVRLVAGARLLELRGVGHQVMQEAPEQLVEAIDEFGAGLVPSTVAVAEA
jgi:pimeloyl-ACP methyl ester carboxylesterase